MRITLTRTEALTAFVTVSVPDDTVMDNDELLFTKLIAPPALTSQAAMIPLPGRNAMTWYISSFDAVMSRVIVLLADTVKASCNFDRLFVIVDVAIRESPPCQSA